jgi:hypothetical protein
MFADITVNLSYYKVKTLQQKYCKVKYLKVFALCLRIGTLLCYYTP